MIQHRFRIIPAGIALLVAIQAFAQQDPGYKVFPGKVIVYPDEKLSGGARTVQVQVMNDHIIHVMASPFKDGFSNNDLSVTMQPVTGKYEIRHERNDIIIQTSALNAIVSIQSGQVSFKDAKGNNLIAERNITGRNITPVMHEGTPLYSLRQVFETSHDDAFYGLGQHQDDVWNYKGRQTVFFQNNTEVAVPFLVSVKNYGILWNNYSFGKAGDTRTYQPLSSLNLFDKNGQQGWLTATYCNDKNKPGEILFAKAESEINYPFINDTRQKLPKEFAIDKGVITWEGQVSSQSDGVHHFKFSYGGYFKVWWNGALQFDKWRQSWNPGTALLEPMMEKGKKYAVRIEWIPDGGESYASAGVLPPIPKEEENSFAFESEAGRQIDYYFVHGNNIDEVISGYRQLTGKAPIVPKWAIGFWQSRERYKSQEELLFTVDEFRKRKIPLDNIVQDWFYWKENEWGSQEFDKSRFPNADSMISTLHKKYKAQFMISVWPKFYEGISAYKEFDSKNWLYKRNIADRQKDWVGPGYVSTFYDVFNTDARKGFWNLLHKKLFVKGIDAWWMDASEPDILSNVSPAKRKEQMHPVAPGTAAEYLNAYPLMNAKGIYEGQRSADNNKRVFLLTRSAFTGSQRYAASIWSGDIASRWEDMRTQISAGLNYSISGLPYWTMDIGGFATEERYNANPMKPVDEEEWRELQARWYQWGSFLPLFRAHGQFPFREVYNIAPASHPAYQSILYYNKFRYRLLPYTYSLAGHTYHNNYTMMRGLVMDFANDKNVLNVGDQFMFGPSLLVNPVYKYKTTGRSVYLPAAQGWYDLYSGKYFTGGQTITADAPYEKVPVFVKEGSIIPAGPELQYVAEKPADPITLFVYSGKDASFRLYEDEGVNYNYENGDFSEISFTYNEASKTLTIGERKGAFAGMLKTRTFNIVLITKDKPAGMQFDIKPAKTARYAGKQLVIKLQAN